MLNLDTHMVVALLRDDLSPREKEALMSDDWMLSDMVLWELAKLRQLGRLDIDIEGEAFQRFLRACTVVPISPRIAVVSTQLDLRADPADEIVAASSIVEDAPLLTRDRTLLQSSLTPLAIPPATGP